MFKNKETLTAYNELRLNPYSRENFHKCLNPFHVATLYARMNPGEDASKIDFKQIFNKMTKYS